MFSFIAAFVLAFINCSGGSGPAPGPGPGPGPVPGPEPVIGALGGPCGEGGACNAGLACLEGKCAEIAAAPKKAFIVEFDAYFVSMGLTKDRGYIVSAATKKIAAGEGQDDAEDKEVPRQTILIKLDEAGKAEWQREYRRGDDKDVMLMLRAVEDSINGGYFAAGLVETQEEPRRPPVAPLIAKLDATGNIVWQKAYRGSGLITTSLVDKEKRRYLIAGIVLLGGNPVYWAGSLFPDGKTEWIKEYSLADDIFFEFPPISITRFGDDYVINCAALLLKIDKGGNVIWAKNFTGVNPDKVPITFSVKATPNGGLITASITPVEADKRQGFMLALHGPNGVVKWQKSYMDRENLHDLYVSSVEISGDGYIVTCVNSSLNDNGEIVVTTTMLKLANNGAIEWSRDIGAPGGRWQFLQTGRTSDGGYAASGFANGFFLPFPSTSFFYKLLPDASFGGACEGILPPAGGPTAVAGEPDEKFAFKDVGIQVVPEGEPNLADIKIVSKETDAKSRMLCPVE